MNRSLTQPATTPLPPEIFQKYRGKWIALSRDESRVIGADDDLGRLEDQLVAVGENPEMLTFDRIEDSDIELGGAELL